MSTGMHIPLRFTGRHCIVFIGCKSLSNLQDANVLQFSFSKIYDSIIGDHFCGLIFSYQLLHCEIILDDKVINLRKIGGVQESLLSMSVEEFGHFQL